MKLKTLKDLEIKNMEGRVLFKDGSIVKYPLVSVVKLKEEAIKWVKECRKPNNVEMTDREFMKFHNVTEEDLK